MTKTVCIYHVADMDGCCSAALLYAFLPKDQDPIEFIGYNYQGWLTAAYLLSKYPDMERVALVDISIEPEEMQHLLASGVRIVWCDHHESAIQKALSSGLISSLPGAMTTYKTGNFTAWLSQNKFCGAQLTWEMLKSTLGMEHQAVDFDYLVELIGAWDTWDLNSDYRHYAECLNAYMSSLKDIRPKNDDDIWKQLFVDPTYLNWCINEGETYLMVEKRRNARIASQFFTLNWEGVRFCAVNAKGNSQLADSVFDPDQHDAVLLFSWYGKVGKWKISMYAGTSNELNLHTIAEKYGGGGHKGACGFFADNLPFALK